VELEIIVLSETSQKQEGENHMFSLMYEMSMLSLEKYTMV
jgi:hypothetical protein